MTIYDLTYRQYAADDTVVLNNSSNVQNEEMRDFYAFLDDEANTKNDLNELEQYLGDPLFPRSGIFDVLAWWRTNAPKYPTVSLMAQDILAILLTSVASEAISRF